MRFSDMNRQEGFTASELIASVFVLGAVAYLVLPLVFPGDLLSVEEKLDKDLQQISSILEERERIAVLNDAVESINIGNLGVYAAYSQVTYQVDVDTDAQEIKYCLIAKIDSTVHYLDSISLRSGPSPLGYCAPDAPESADAGAATEEGSAESETSETPADETTLPVDATTESNSP